MKQLPPAFTVCVICEKNIFSSEKCEFSKTKRGKTLYFHTECYEKQLKRSENRCGSKGT